MVKAIRVRIVLNVTVKRGRGSAPDAFMVNAKHTHGAHAAGTYREPKRLLPLKPDKKECGIVQS